MPHLSRWFVRASLLYLWAGFSLGSLLLLHKGIHLDAMLWALLPAHIEFLVSGWIVQLAMGVAFWILPRFPEGAPRGNESIAWAAFVLLNLGIWLVALGPVLMEVPWLVLAGRLLETGSALTFVIHAWRRVRPLEALGCGERSGQSE